MLKHVEEEGTGSSTEAHSKGRQVRGGKGTSRKTVKQKIQVFKTSRGKKKYTTSVIGLSTFGTSYSVSAAPCHFCICNVGVAHHFF